MGATVGTDWDQEGGGGGGGGGHIIIPTSWPATEIYHAPRPKTNAYIIYTSLYMNPYRRYSIILYIR